MAISKIVLNGVTQMDLTNDTTDASKTLAPYTGHGADGEVFTGVATLGVDIPQFTVNFDDNSDIISTSCSHTYAQCESRFNNGSKVAYLVVNFGVGGSYPHTSTFPLNAVSDSNNILEYVGFYDATPNVEVTYSSSGQITYSSETDYVSFPTITTNGDYFPTKGVYGGVFVDVPSSAGTYQAKTNINPTTSSQTITADSGYDALSSVQINAMPTGTAGTPTATKGTVSNHSVSVTPSVTNTTGYITGGTKTGTAVSVSASELVSGTYTVTSSGTKDVTNYASASIASGTEGTPSATKGTVSNHSVSVTPSVTNTSGWITGGTKTGTAVTVSASELVSGTYNITTSGTHDVTNYASASVTFISVYSGSSTPSSSTGANGDIYIKTS